MSEFRIPILTENELREFVKDVLAGSVITWEQVPEKSRAITFSAVGFGGFSKLSKEESDRIGTIYGYWKDAVGSMGINGFPMLSKTYVMGVEQWKKARAAIVKAQAAQDEVLATL